MMIENNEVAEVLDILGKRAGANTRQCKMIRHTGFMDSEEMREK